MLHFYLSFLANVEKSELLWVHSNRAYNWKILHVILSKLDIFSLQTSVSCWVCLCLESYCWIIHLMMHMYVFCSSVCAHACLDCPTSYTMDCSPSGSSVHGIFQGRILDRVAISYHRVPSQPKKWTWVSWVYYIPGRFFIHWAIQKLGSPVCV